jgi:SAM-dependent methyltransferase
MNLVHRWMCRSARWRRKLEEQVLPWVLGDVELGPDVLEVGPGPGLTTELLLPLVERLTAIEIDRRLAESLAARLHGTPVRVIRGDATAMPFGSAQFTGAVSFTMLHHVPSPALQDQLLREVRRVLKPGGILAGIDSRQRLSMRLFHIHDTLVPVDPRTFGARLEAAGFENVRVETDATAFRFRAQCPKNHFDS